MRRVILSTGRRAESVLDLSPLTDAGFTVERRYDLENSLDEDKIIAGLSDAWAVVAGGERYSRRVLAALPGLQVVARVGVGYDRVDVAAATELGKLVSITPNTIEPAVAEWAMTHILALRRGLFEADRAVRSGQWTLPDVLSPGLLGATVGLVGLGRIAREVVKRLAGFGCTLIGTDPVANAIEWQARGVEVVSLEELLRRSDIVSLHLPLMDSTRHIIGAEELALMRPTAILVNTSRGGLVDEVALIDALRSGRIAGAGLDTFETEPLPTTSPLLELPHVIVTGHIAYATHAAARSSAQNAVNAVSHAAAGRLPEGALNPDVIKRPDFGRTSPATS